MLFNKQKQICFMMTPKCASTSLKAFLKRVGFKMLTHSTFKVAYHTKYKDAVKPYPNLVNYKKYGVFRDPLDRFISGVNFAQKDSETKLSYDEFVLAYPNIVVDSFVFEPQVEWLNVEDIHIFDFKWLAFDMSSMFDVPLTSFPHRNKVERSSDLASDMVKEFVRKHYAADYQFAKDVLGKEY
jgi:hypothetical protein